MWIQRTLPLLRKVNITIPRLSPTFTKAKIYKWAGGTSPPTKVEPYDVVCVVQCTPDLLSEENHPDNGELPLMILESQEEGTVTIFDQVLKQQGDDKWYIVGDIIGEIDDGVDDGDEGMEWTWQAYNYSSDKDLE
jgi:hypothetical protein